MLPGESTAQVVRELKDFLKENNLSAQISSIQTGRCAPLETSLRQPLVEEFFRATGQTSVVGVDYFSDAGVLAAAGIPSVLFGPGDIAQAHTPDEWLSLGQLERSKEMLVHFFRRLS